MLTIILTTSSDYTNVKNKGKVGADVLFMEQNLNRWDKKNEQNLDNLLRDSSQPNNLASEHKAVCMLKRQQLLQSEESRVSNKLSGHLFLTYEA